MKGEATELAVVSLASAPDDGAWALDYLPFATIVPVKVDEKRLEAQLTQALQGRSAHVVVSIEHVLMGYLCKRVIQCVGRLGLEAATLIHPRAHVSSHAKVGQGVLVAAGAVIEAGAAIGDHARIWQNAVVACGAKVSAYTTLDAGCVLQESCTVGAHCWLRGGVIVDKRAIIADHCELHLPGAVSGETPEGTLHLRGIEGPVRIHRFG